MFCERAYTVIWWFPNLRLSSHVGSFNLVTSCLISFMTEVKAIDALEGLSITTGRQNPPGKRVRLFPVAIWQPVARVAQVPSRVPY